RTKRRLVRRSSNPRGRRARRAGGSLSVGGFCPPALQFIVNATTEPAVAANSLPLAAIGVAMRATFDNASAPPSNTTAPVSPSNPWILLSPLAAIHHTIASAVPFVVVTIGEPAPLDPAHHATEMAGGEAAEILSAVSCPEP